MTLLSGVLGGVAINRSDETSALLVLDRVQVLDGTADRPIVEGEPVKWRLRLSVANIYHEPSPPDEELGVPGDEGGWEYWRDFELESTLKPYASSDEMGDWGPEGVAAWRRERARKWHRYATVMQTDNAAMLLDAIIAGKPFVISRRRGYYVRDLLVRVQLTPGDRAKALVWMDQQLEKGLL